jgi:hypothetical protein
MNAYRTQSVGEKADGGGKAHEAKQGRAPTSGNEGSNPSPTSVTFGSAPISVEPERCVRCWHIHTGVCQIITGLRWVNLLLGEMEYSNQIPSRCGCPVLIPMKGGQ